jgi:hypothetical protein
VEWNKWDGLRLNGKAPNNSINKLEEDKSFSPIQLFCFKAVCLEE